MQPLLSIAIPTFNRSVYMIKCLRSILEIEGKIELVISDSSTDLLLKNLLENDFNYFLKDSRLKYLFTDDTLDMTSNLNRAIEHCTGHYIIFLGDDDTLVPEILQYLELFKKLNYELIAPDVVVNYAWPDFSTKYFKNGHKSNLYIDYNKPFIKKVSTSLAYEEALKNCFQGTDGLPKLYHGFVSRDLLLNIKNKTNNYLHGSTPDMSAAIGLCFVSDYYIKCNFPLTIPGASGMSNTGRAANNKHVGKLEEESQTSNISLNSWIIGIPRFFSVEIVWAQAGIETASKFDKSVLMNFPFDKFISICIVNHLDHFKSSLNALKELIHKKHKYKFYRTFIFVIIFSFKKLFRFIKRVMNPTATNGREHLKNITDIYQAQLAYKNDIKKDLNFNLENNLKMILNFNKKYE